MITNLENMTTIGSVATIINSTLLQYKFTAKPVFDAAGINYDEIGDPDSRFSTSKMQKLWRLCIEITKDPEFGFKAAQLFQPTALHGLGFSWLASETSRDALSRLVKYSSLLVTYSLISLKDKGNEIELTIAARQELANVVPASIDFCFLVILRMCRMASAKSLSPKHVFLNRPQPDDDYKRLIEELSQCNISYDAPQLKIVFDRQELESPLVNSNPNLARINDQVVEDYLSRFETNSVSNRVREEVINQLPSGKSDANLIAKHLHMSRRTLHRKLTEEGQSYKEIHNDIRRELALKYLKQPGRTSTEISYLLGFSEPANFSRAFTRWFGYSPSKYRHLH